MHTGHITQHGKQRVKPIMENYWNDRTYGYVHMDTKIYQYRYFNGQLLLDVFTIFSRSNRTQLPNNYP